jgi:hypothetical protein
VYYVNNNNNNNKFKAVLDNNRFNAIHNNNRPNAILVPEGPFCFCMNANNNTYSCLRTINATHNFLYCEFVTGLVTFYNLRIGKIMNNPHTSFVSHPSRHLIRFHVYFIYILMAVDQKEFAHTCTYHMLSLLQSKWTYT